MPFAGWLELAAALERAVRPAALAGTGGVTRLVALLALVLTLPAPALAARRRADLTPGSARAQGATLRVTVRNRGKAAARATQLSVALNGKVLARTRVAALKPGRSATVSLTLPRLAPGRHDLSICADAGKAVKEASERNNCTKLSLTLPPPTPVPSPPRPAETPAPAATPQPTPAPTPTPTPTATATPTATPVGEVPPEDLPPLIPAFEDQASELYAAQHVAEDAIAPERVGIIHGRVLQAGGQPLAGVTVTVHDHPELGSATTAGDGTFELAANGGAQLTLVYRKTGYLEVQRDIDPEQLDYSGADEVRLVQADQVGVVLNPPAAAAWTVARASTHNDGAGARASTLLFAPGTTATMHLPGGATQPLPAPWTVRQTEYTAAGPPAMPGDLPATSGYTYAAELSIDEAEAAGAETVVLTPPDASTPPAVNYVENFIGAPVGTNVPTGAYDREDAAWQASPDGRVVKVISETGGMADLDTDGDGDSDAADAPAALKLTPGERTALAALFEPGAELLRVPIPHLSAWDHNWPFSLPPGWRQPKLGPDGRPLPDMCQEGGSSTIDCEDQTLREAVPVAGTPYELSYSSAWTRDAARRSIDVGITDATLPPGLVGIELDVEVAGRHLGHRWANPASPPPGAALPAIVPNLTDHLDWDGRGLDGQLVIGAVRARVTLTYYYTPVYNSPGPTPTGISFASLATSGTPTFTGGVRCATGTLFAGTGDLCPFGVSTSEIRVLGGIDRSSTGLGGWDLDVHHIFDPATRDVLLGDGTRRSNGEVDLGVVRTVAGPGVPGYTGPPITGGGREPFTVLPDGSIVIVRAASFVERWVPGQGLLHLGGTDDEQAPRECDGAPATTRQLRTVTAIAARPDGSVVLAQSRQPGAAGTGSRICLLTTDGRLIRLAGTDNPNCGTPVQCRGDGGPALDAVLTKPYSMTVGEDGSIYFYEDGSGAAARIRKIDPGGLISTYAGGGTSAGPFDPEGRPALADTLAPVRPQSLAMMPDGTLLMTDPTRGMIIAVGTDGFLHRYAGVPGGASSFDADRRSAAIGRPQEVAAARDGSVYVFTDAGSRARILRIRPDGIVVRALGFGDQNGVSCPPTFGGLFTELEGAVDRCSPNPGFLAIDGAGRPNYAEVAVGSIRRIESSLSVQAPQASTLVPSADGSEVWAFDSSGRHLKTLDGLTGATLLEFGYDAAGRLLRVEDADGHRTFVERDGAGRPTAILAPDGRRTFLEVSAGRLTKITDPLGGARGLGYDAGGFLNHQDLPSGRHSDYRYGASGRLIEATGAAGQKRTLARAELADGTVQVDVTTGEGRKRRYTTQLTAGGLRRTLLTTSGSQTQLVIAGDGTRTLTLPSGEIRTSQPVSDPRFGEAVPRVRNRTITTPSGKTTSATYSYAALRSAPNTVFAPTSLSFTAVTALGTTTTAYDGPTRTYTTTTAAGRRLATTLDQRGRPVHVEVGAPDAGAPVDVTYDSSGGVATLTQDTQVTRYEHDAAGRVTAIVAADGQRVELGYDAADRVTERRYPGGRTYGYGYDADGVLTSRTLPSGKAHGFTPTGLEGEISSWTPPGGQGAYGATRDEDELATSVQYPSGAQRTVASDAGGRPTSLAFPAATRTATYAVNVDRIARYGSTAAPAGAAQSLDTVFDGTSLTQLTAAGLAPAETTFAYGATTLQRTSSRLVSGADDVTLSYTRDADGVLTGSGPFTYERNGPDRAVSAITDGTARTEETVDPVAGLATRVLKVGGVEKYRLELTADATGRIVSRHELTAGGDHTYAYTHDAVGELREVRRDGALVETYGYNVDGDRTTHGNETATYDAGGKLATRGATSYGFDADGFLAARGADTFGYDRSGDLRSATVGATTVEYAYDGLGRRVARVEGGLTTRYVYGDPDDPYRISAARAPNGVLDRYLYGPRGNLYAILRGASRFYVATDQVGSPRVVVDSPGPSSSGSSTTPTGSRPTSTPASSSRSATPVGCATR